MSLSNVDFPQPLSPRIPRNSPCATLRLKFSRTSRSPYEKERSFTTISGSVARSRFNSIPFVTSSATGFSSRRFRTRSPHDNDCDKPLPSDATLAMAGKLKKMPKVRGKRMAGASPVQIPIKITAQVVKTTMTSSNAKSNASCSINTT